MNAIVPLTNAEVYRASTDAAGLCGDIVKKTAQNIQGKKYVKVEGWQAIAVAHGCVASSEDVQRVDDDGMSGYKAIGVIRRITDGVEVARAEGFLGDDETTWAKRPVYARRAMAQTRAISRACRSAFAHVVVLIDADLSTTPAEEVPFGGFPERQDGPRDITTNQPTIKRLTSSRAKEVGLDQKLKDKIELCESEASLDAFEVNFDKITEEAPLSWLDSIRNNLILRREEIRAEQANGAMDAEFKAVMA